MRKNDDILMERRMYRYWVELRDLRDGSVRELPVKLIQRILLKGKRMDDAPEIPLEIRMRVEDEGRTWEARDKDDLSRQLRKVYPDGTFERSLKCVRDPEAEERVRSAMDGLARIIAETVVRDVLADEAKT